MIDTPNKEGIDKENLIKNIGLLAEADKYTEEMKTQYQIILTTGIDTYPEEFKNNVFFKLEGENLFITGELREIGNLSKLFALRRQLKFCLTKFILAIIIFNM